jgi:Mrp family chromosome partitioning ATPase
MSGGGRRDEPQALGSDDVSVLVISGPGGVAKSTVAYLLPQPSLLRGIHGVCHPHLAH